MYKISVIAAELPLPVLGMLAIAHAQYDTQAQCRQWGGYGVLGSGLTTDLDLWSVSQDVVLVDGRKVDCVRLTKRPGFLAAEPGTPIDYRFPLEQLRAGVVAQLTLVVAS